MFFHIKLLCWLDDVDETSDAGGSDDEREMTDGDDKHDEHETTGDDGLEQSSDDTGDSTVESQRGKQHSSDSKISETSGGKDTSKGDDGIGKTVNKAVPRSQATLRDRLEKAGVRAGNEPPVNN